MLKEIAWQKIGHAFLISHAWPCDYCVRKTLQIISLREKNSDNERVNLTCVMVTRWHGFNTQIICRVASLNPSSIPNTNDITVSSTRRLPRSPPCTATISAGSLAHDHAYQISTRPRPKKNKVSMTFCSGGINERQSSPPLP